MKRLIMFTAAYPYDRTNVWKGQELSAFRSVFDKVYVAPLYQRQRELSPDLPENVRVLPPVFPIDARPQTAFGRIVSLLNRRLLQHIAHSERARHVRDFRRFWAAIADLEAILQSEAWRDHVAPLLPDSLLYFFWGRGYASVIPGLDPELRNRSLVRLHRWDLYPDINDGYIPFSAGSSKAPG